MAACHVVKNSAAVQHILDGGFLFAAHTRMNKKKVRRFTCSSLLSVILARLSRRGLPIGLKLYFESHSSSRQRPYSPAPHSIKKNEDQAGAEAKYVLHLFSHRFRQNYVRSHAARREGQRGRVSHLKKQAVLPKIPFHVSREGLRLHPSGWFVQKNAEFRTV